MANAASRFGLVACLTLSLLAAPATSGQEPDVPPPPPEAGQVGGTLDEAASPSGSSDATTGTRPTPPEAPDEGSPEALPQGDVAATGSANISADTSAPEPTLHVRGFAFSGNRSVTTHELEQVVRPYVGRACTLEDLRAAAAKVTEAYHARGLDLVRAYLPAQEIDQGVVTIAVLEGELGRVVVEGNRNYSDEFVADHITGAFTDGPARSSQLEHALLVLNEFKDLKVTATLERGERAGTVDVRARVEDAFPLRLTLSFNNFGSEYVSRYRFGAHIDWTNALLPGAHMSLSGAIGEEPDNLIYGAASYTVPLNRHGTRVGVSGGYGNFQVSQDLDLLEIHGFQAYAGAFVSQAVVRSRTFNLSAELGFQAKNAKFYALDEETGHDELRMVTLGLLADHIALGGKTFASVNVTQGLGEALGAMENGDLDASRLEADNSFTRVTVQLGRIQPLNGYVGLFARIACQWASESLVASEEWQVGGADSVRGFAPGEAAGDHGFVASVELRVTPLEDKELLVLVAFADHGAAYRDEVAIGQRDSESLTGAGLGVRTHFEKFVSVDIRLDIGWPVDPNENVLNERPVLYAAAAVRF